MMPAASPPMASIARGAFFLLSAIVIGSRAQSVGEACSINGSPGICKALPQCPVVYNALLAGKRPEKLCGFQGFDPVICCPTAQPTPRPTTTQRPPSGPVTVGPFSSNSRRGNVARAQCAIYAKSVYGLELPPILSAGKPALVNVSRCAIEQRKLIVGGKNSDPKEFPHMTAIGYKSTKGISWSCGGTLISERFVLSAAHCAYSDDWGTAIMARLGDLNLRKNDDDARPQDIRIIDRIIHPQYKPPSGYHDIAVFKLERDVEFDAYIRPACLPYSFPDTGTSKKAIATGWGRVDWSDEEGADALQKVTLKLVDNLSCNNSFIDGADDKVKLGIVEDWQICAGEFGFDTCQGDSGGPLAIFNDDHSCMYSVIGVTSLGRVCGSIVPGVYTRIYHYLPWIESVVWPQNV